MTISELALEPGDGEPVRRFEVFTGSGRRRSWSAAEKARIVAESDEPGVTVSEVARRYVLSPQQLFAWRRAVRRIGAAAPSPPMFVPAVVTAASEPGATRAARRRQEPVDCPAGVIELEIAGIIMRVRRGTDAQTVTAVIHALKAAL